MTQEIVGRGRLTRFLRSLCRCKALPGCLCPCKKSQGDNFPELCVQGPYLLPELAEAELRKHCMIIDLDETLVHSTFEPIPNPDFIIPVEISGGVQKIYVLKRPYVDEFLERMGQLYECVLFTASLGSYAGQLINLLDKWNAFRFRLYRESCVFQHGCYIKDLSKLGRNLERVVIFDNSPTSYLFHPDNAVPVTSWFDDKTDAQLLYIMPFFERLAEVENVYTVLRNSNHPFNDMNKKQNLNKEFLTPVGF